MESRKLLKELDKKHDAACEAVEEIEKRISDEIREATRAIQEKYAALLALARTKRFEAWSPLNDERNRIALAEAKPPYPEGTVLVRWDRRWAHELLGKTGDRGVVEICRPDTVFPSNIGISRPAVGQWFIRMLDKSGKTGKKVDLRHGFQWWHPEGVDPNKKLRKAKTK